MQNQEVAIKEYQSQVSFVRKGAESLVIASAVDMEKASDLLSSIKQVKNSITERKEGITRPLMDSLASVRDLFKPLESGYVEAEKTIKAKMLDFTINEEARIENEKARVEARVAKGTMRTDTALKKMEGIGDKKKGYEGSIGKVQIKTVRRVRIVDEALIPREYLVPDIKKITEAVLLDKNSVAGAEVYEEKMIASTATR